MNNLVFIWRQESGSISSIHKHELVHTIFQEDGPLGTPIVPPACCCKNFARTVNIHGAEIGEGA